VSEAKLTDEITVKLQDGMRRRLDAIAAADRRRPSQWVRMLIERAIEQHEAAQAANGEKEAA
jgi:predicted transcriptional regulator